MRVLHIDLETFSEADLSKTGVYRYVEDPSFEVLLFGVSVDDGQVEVYDLKQGDAIPAQIIAALQDNTVTKWAFNAQFERICLSRYLWDAGLLEKGHYLDPCGWRCDMVWAGYCGFPMNLKGAGAALQLDEQKMDEGKSLITYFCKPYRPTSRNGYTDRNLPEHDPEKWELFKTYNKRDVEVEIAIANKLAKHPVPEQVWEEYWMDQTINDRGILVDIPLVENAIRLDTESKQHLKKKMKSITGLANPQSVQQMQNWLRRNGVQLDSLGKKEIAGRLSSIDEPMRSVLLLRLQLAKSAVKKYTAMDTAACADGRCRGMFQFYGANRSGRFAGKIIQLQNLFRNSLPDLDQARTLVAQGNYDALAALYDSVPEVLAQCVRTAFIPAPGYKFIVSDFSAIEARVIAWLAGEQWRMEAFERGDDIYCASASQMFGVPVVKHGVNGHLRQKGKVAELGLGYGGGVGALKAMGALEMGLKEQELQPLVNTWRAANPNIVKLWWAVEKAIKTTVKSKTTTRTHNLTFRCKDGSLYITLPSGRDLVYVQPRMGENRFGSEAVTYMGTDITKHWSRIETFGGKAVENIVQGIARDILCHALGQLSDYRVVAHVHDECIVECPRETTVEEISSKMAVVPPWADGLILRADGYECPGYYMKD